ncbi:MAG: AmmeMemoRadiSam system protein B [Xanthomonadales bacterium]|nr:AmmeMemoRadiSam system protein B [Xanthomonadales bacterium]
MTVIREPAVAGVFYPADADELRATVQAFMKRAEPRRGPTPKALIVPHAGYVYSGPVAATAYAGLLPYRDCYKRVILLGPSHRVAIRNLASSGADVFRTPLGDIALDRKAIASLDESTTRIDDDAHEFEHSLEVHLPFLQCTLGSFSLVPLVVGGAAPETVAAVISSLWGGSETLIVVSSDLTHYLDYDTAQKRDMRTCGAIEQLDAGRIDHDDACGVTPVRGLLIEARRRSLQVNTLDLRNSGDTAGDKDRVVGYGAWVFSQASARAA